MYFGARELAHQIVAVFDKACYYEIEAILDSGLSMMYTDRAPDPDDFIGSGARFRICYVEGCRVTCDMQQQQYG